MAQQEDFTIDQGSDVAIRLDLFNTDGSRKVMNTVDSAGVLFSKFSITGKLKKTYNTKDSDAVPFTATSIDPDNLDNVVHLSLTNLQTSTLKTGRYVYDVELKSIDSNESGNIELIERILQGTINVTPSVT